MLRNKKWIALCVLAVAFQACVKDHNPQPDPTENPAAFREVSSTKIGGEAAAEISAYDPATKRLFTVNNEAKALVDVLDLSALPTVTKIQSIDISALGGVANSVSVSDGTLAIALEATNKQANGSVIVMDTKTLKQIKQITVGALPDMVTFSPDGKYIVTANEGEPNASYTNDPVGSISIIDVTNNYSVRTLTFDSFAPLQAQLQNGGFRIFGPNASFAQDIEPEYVAVSQDSKKAWVTLQENNGIAEVDLVSGAIVKLHPLGTVDVSLPENAIDPSNEDGTIAFATWPIKSLYLPDAISYFNVNNTGYLITANEGDAREYDAFVEQARISTLKLDPIKFPNAATLQKKEQLGRLYVTKTLGDTDKDGDYDELYAFGGRGFSIREAATGQLIYNSGKSMEEEVVKSGAYDDSRSDDKGVEPEGVTVGRVNGKLIAFIALERADAVAIYDVSNPKAPQFLQLLRTGDAPEGILFVAPDKSPNGRSMLIVSSEGDGTVKVYQPDRL